MSLHLTLEGRNGDKIEDLALEAAIVAQRLGIGVCFDFNGVACTIYPGEHPDGLVKNYHRVVLGNGPRKFAYAT